MSNRVRVAPGAAEGFGGNGSGDGNSESGRPDGGLHVFDLDRVVRY